jgi:hypothetical protein
MLWPKFGLGTSCCKSEMLRLQVGLKRAKGQAHVIAPTCVCCVQTVRGTFVKSRNLYREHVANCAKYMLPQVVSWTCCQLCRVYVAATSALNMLPTEQSLCCNHIFKYFNISSVLDWPTHKQLVTSRTFQCIAAVLRRKSDTCLSLRNAIRSVAKGLLHCPPPLLYPRTHNRVTAFSVCSRLLSIPSLSLSTCLVTHKDHP